MYKMKADGVVFYDPSSDDTALHVLSPKAKYELNKAGSLSFTMLPGNVMYNSLQKMKTIITLEQDDEVIFRGRVLETTSDTYNLKEVYCEGELSYLLDSLQRPYKYDGNAKEYLSFLIDRHNEDVEAYKQFTVGDITALIDEDTVKTESDDYRDTLAEIRGLLLNEFNGYLRIRHVDGIRYLDYVDKFNQSCSQEINFGVNLVDISNKVNAQDICTVLVPLGKQVSGKYTTIADVNDGKDYIEDTEAIAKYGRIVKTYTWNEVEDPAELLAMGQEHMNRMQADTTLTIKAVDLHTCGADVDGIRLGDTVKLLSLPHGLDKEDVCTRIDLDIENPEESEYTFGLPVETLTDNHASAMRKNASDMGHVHRWLIETDNSFEVFVNETNSKILLKADKIELEGYVKITDLETGVLTVLDSATIPALNADSVVSGTGDFDEVWFGQMNGESPEWKGTTVLTGIGTVSQSKRFLNVMLADGSSVQLDIVTDVSITPDASYINYLGKQ